MVDLRVTLNKVIGKSKKLGCQIIVPPQQSYLNTQRETITMLSMENFFALAMLLVFIFKVIVPLLPSD